jgi:hypothetical protein
MRKAMLIAALLLGGCEARVGTEEKAPADGAATARAEQGKVTFRGPGFGFSVNVPKLGQHASVNENEGLLYPGASITGLAIEAKAEGSSVDLRFASPDAPQKVAGWYRDPARAAAFTVDPGTGPNLSGRTKGDGDRFRLELRPASGGGTDARLAILDAG